MTFVVKNGMLLLQPLGFVWLLWTLYLLAAGVRRGWRSVAIPGLGWLILSALTCTPLSSWLLAQLENQHPPVKMADLPEADVIVCLGGGGEPSALEPTGVHLKSAADRLSTALTMAAERKASVLVIGGGGYPYQGQMLSEADFIVAHLKQNVTLPCEVISLGLCSDTHDELERFDTLRQTRGWKRVSMVTSASHMPRAAAVAAKLGIVVTPVPCNYQSSFNRAIKMEWFHLPHHGGFENFGAWFHETIGMWIYRRRGWA